VAKNQFFHGFHHQRVLINAVRALKIQNVEAKLIENDVPRATLQTFPGERGHKNFPINK